MKIVNDKNIHIVVRVQLHRHFDFVTYSLTYNAIKLIHFINYLKSVFFTVEKLNLPA